MREPMLPCRCGVCGEQQRLLIERRPLAHLTAITCLICNKVTLSMDHLERDLTPQPELATKDAQ